MRYGIVLAMLLLALAPARPAGALSCVQMTPQEYVDRAQAVAVGRVIQAAPGRGTSPEPVGIEVDKVYKGTLTRRDIIMHNERVGPDIALEQDHRYLFFLTARDDGTWRTSLCDGTREIGTSVPSEFAAVLGPGGEPALSGDPAAGPAHWIWTVLNYAILALLLVTLLWMGRRTLRAGRRDRRP